MLALGLRDADNILAGLVHKHAQYVVTMVQDTSYIPIGLQLGARSIIHPNLLILEALMNGLSPAWIEHIHVLSELHSGNTEPILLVTAVLREDIPILNMKPEDLEPLDLKVIAVLRKKKLLFTLDSFLNADQLLVMCSHSNYAQLLDILAV